MALGNQFNIDVKQGATFQLTITWKDSAGTAINLTGYTARAQARLTYDTSTTIFSLTSSAGITLGGAAGTIAIVIAAGTTAALAAPWSGVWDLELVSGAGIVTRLLEGTANVSPEVTR
jgi:hypothetical protein